MEDWGISVNSDINDALESVLHGKETPEEREEALLDFIKKYDKSANECIEDLKTRALAKSSVMIMIALLSAILGAILGAVVYAKFFVL